MDILTIFLQNITSPPILFFILGVFAGFLKSDLDIPDQISSYLSIYLMMAIGFKGGAAIAATPEINLEIISVIIAGIITGFTQPFIGYLLLRLTTKLDSPTAAAVAAHYGSISMVTFATAVSFLEINHIFYAAYVVAVLALMEAPAILTGLFIAHKARPETIESTERVEPKLAREIFTNGAILLLTGSFIVGALSGQAGMDKMSGFLIEPFHGILAFFLLDMGLLVSKQMHHLKEFNLRLVLFGIYMPLIGCAVGLSLSIMIGLDLGTGFLFTTLIASASYIAVTAAMRLALPEAKAAIYIPMSLAITFPFNVTIGIPFYFYIAQKFLT
ncbi:sodium-dependent bicarbonate transport family permease [Rickettsiales bacterium]|nr:sodium-dependent bicarbonate transport family permease [Rickettsiales bacterium]MDB2550729.1 sodium-dependent bicarbonate transport family permease [Rickettsiales bacterium]